MGHNYHTLKKYYADGNKPWNYSDVGKGLICRHCGQEFNVHPHKVRAGKAKYCSLNCYNVARTNPDRSEQIKQRLTREYKDWKRAVLERDDFTCQECGLTGAEGAILTAHHIKSFKDNPDIRIDLDNGIALCRNCHHKIHHGYALEYGKCQECGKQCSQKARRCRACDDANRRIIKATYQEKMNKVVVLYQSGLSLRQVGKEIGMNHKSILHILKNMGIKTRNHSEAATLRYAKERDKCK